MPDLGIARVREVVFQNYRIMCEARTDGVVILAVMHGAMDFGAMAEGLGWSLRSSMLRCASGGDARYERGRNGLRPYR